jgi:hypothetical protein
MNASRLLSLSILASILATGAPVFAQAPANDDCLNAIPVFDGINPGAPTGASGFTFTNVNATEVAAGLSCLGGTLSTSDVWFTYIATSTGPCIFQTCTPAGFANGTLGDTLLEVYDVCNGVRLACDDDACWVQGLGSSTSTSVLAGTQYVIRMSSYSSANTVEGTFYLSVIPTPAVPPGDDCSTSLATIFGDGIYQGTTVGATSNAFPPPAPVCSALLGTTLDVWFYYLAPASGQLSISLEGSDTTATNGLDVAGANLWEFADASFGCGAWPSTLLCNAAALSGQQTVTVTAGVLYAMGFGVAPGAQQGVFSVSLSLALVPANDDCAVPTPVVDGTNPSVGIFTNNLATNAVGFAATCAGGAVGSRDVWYQYVATQTGNITATTCTPSGFTAGSLTDTILEVYSSCATTTPLACNDDDPACGTGSTAVFPAVAGTPYLLRVAAKSTTATGTFYLTLSPAPGNDECTTPTPLALGANGPFFHLGASNSAQAAPSCAPTNGDLWFSYTAPNSGTLTASACGSTFDATLAVYSSCGGAPVACDADDLQNLGPCATSAPTAPFLRFAAVAGTTYLFRLGAAAPIITGTSFLNLAYEFSFVVTPNPGALQVTLSNVAATPSGLVLNVVTLSAGAYPNGWFYGVDVPWFELFTLVALGPPFLATTSPAGTFSQTLGGAGYPTGLTFYCVGVDLGTIGAPVAATDPFSVTL